MVNYIIIHIKNNKKIFYNKILKIEGVKFIDNFMNILNIIRVI